MKKLRVILSLFVLLFFSNSLTAQKKKSPIPISSSKTLPEAEFCHYFDADVLEITEIDGRFVITEWGRRIISFSDRGSASLAYKVLKFYDLSHICFTNIRRAPLVYFKSGRDIPSGDQYETDCYELKEPNNLQIEGTRDFALNIVDGGKILFRNLSRKEAEDIIAIFEYYDARKICYIKDKNGDVGMMYLKK